MIDNRDDFEDMICFFGLYFGMEFDLYGQYTDEIIQSAIKEDIDYARQNNLRRPNNELILSTVELAVPQMLTYMDLFGDNPDESDKIFDKQLGCEYLYIGDYVNSIEFLKNVIGKIYFYRDLYLDDKKAEKSDRALKKAQEDSQEIVKNLDKYSDFIGFIDFYCGKDLLSRKHSFVNLVWKDRKGSHHSIVDNYMKDNREIAFAKIVPQLQSYLNEFGSNPNASDYFFDHHFETLFPYKRYYLNSIEFLKNLLGKMLPYKP